MKRCALLIIALFAFMPERIEAQAADSAGDSLASGERHRKTLYLDVGTLLLLGNGSINFEAPLGPSALLRLGFGLGYFADISGESSTQTSAGLLAMVNYVPGGTRSGFECGGGASLMKIHEGDNEPAGYFTSPGWRVFPAFTLGYRHEPPSGGFLFRAGVGFTYAYGAGLYVSLGSSL